MIDNCVFYAYDYTFVKIHLVFKLVIKMDILNKAEFLLISHSFLC